MRKNKPKYLIYILAVVGIGLISLLGWIFLSDQATVGEATRVPRDWRMSCTTGAYAYCKDLGGGEVQVLTLDKKTIKIQK